MTPLTDWDAVAARGAEARAAGEAAYIELGIGIFVAAVIVGCVLVILWAVRQQLDRASQQRRNDRAQLSERLRTDEARTTDGRATVEPDRRSR